RPGHSRERPPGVRHPLTPTAACTRLHRISRVKLYPAILAAGSGSGSMGPSRNRKAATPATSTRPAIRNASTKEWVLPTTKPVTMGATTPIMLLEKFMMPPTAPTPALGATSEGRDQATGAAAASPVKASDIHASAIAGRLVVVAPNTARAVHNPVINTVLRTRVWSYPLRIRASISQPPTSRSDSEAQAHGMAARPADARMLRCVVRTM